MYGCESWTLKKAECQRIDAFELWCWRRLLRVPWTARRSNQSILKEINPEYSWAADSNHFPTEGWKHLEFPAWFYVVTTSSGSTYIMRRQRAFELLFKQLVNNLQCIRKSETFGRNDTKAETPVLWPPHAKSWLIGKDSDAGRDWGQEEKGTTEDEMAGWHHGLDGRESEWTPGVGDGQGGLVCCDSWGRKESDTTERLNWTEVTQLLKYLNVICPKPWKIIPFFQLLASGAFAYKIQCKRHI